MSNAQPQPVGFTADRVKTYDDRVRRHIPGYEMSHALADISLAPHVPPTASLLIVGIGTGMEILDWGAKHSGWQFVGTDTAPAMLGLAQEKINAANLESRVRLHAGPVEEAPQELFDAATLMLVLHFVPDAKKLDMLCAIAERLKPGAPFLLANLFGDPESTRFLKLNDARKAWAIAKGLEPAMAEQFCDPTRSDIHIVPEETLKTLMRDAGFIDIQRVYQALTVGMWSARAAK